MQQRKIVIGQKFGRLTVVSKAPSEQGGKAEKRWYGAWNCICECGEMLSVKTYHLNEGRVRSCGCLLRLVEPGQIFGRLTTIQYMGDMKWKCKCICGTINEINTGALTTGNTKSCGCLNADQLSARAPALIEARRKNEPKIASARRVWQGYKSHDSGMMEFDDFYHLSQQHCFYCGIEPQRKSNMFLAKSNKGSDKAKQEGWFIFNGIDRVDNNVYHTKENCVACCLPCNMAKNDRSIDEFYRYISHLMCDNIIPDFNNLILIDNCIKLPIDTSIVSLRVIWKTYCKYDETETLTINQFHHIAQLPCFYCGATKLNACNKSKIPYRYNGLDRLDPSRLHTLDNIVPCCYYCNFAKSSLTFAQFQSWIARIKSFNAAKTL
jgi:hypothetical protein